jgi:hypothetical protein
MAKPTAALLPMRKEVEISASYTGKISTGKWENLSPFFSIKETWQNVTDEDIQNRQKVLHDMCESKFNEVDQQATVAKILQERQDLRFYDYKGLKLPSVTSIIGWDEDMYVTPNQLIQYAARGTAIHKQCEIFLKTGQWLEVKDIPEVYAEYVIVTKGDMNLKFDDVNFRAFYSAHKFDVVQLEQVVYNLDYRYAGRTDIVGTFEGKKSLLDIKTGTTINREKAFKQMSAYAKSLEGIEQIVVIHLNNGTKQGFSKPIVSDEIEKYFQLFLRDRESFKQRFGV